MTRYLIQSEVLTVSGQNLQITPGAEALVLGSDGEAATLYTGATGLGEASNPITADENGAFEFYVEHDDYIDITASGGDEAASKRHYLPVLLPDVNPNVAMSYPARNTASLTAIRDSGVVGWADGLQYVYEAGGTAGADLGVSDVVPYGDLTNGHYGIDLTGATDNTAQLTRMGNDARLTGGRIVIDHGSVAFSGNTDIDFRDIEDCDICAWLVRGAGTAKVLFGSQSGSTVDKNLRISAYDTADPFGTDDGVDPVVGIEGLKHFTIDGTISHLRILADGSGPDTGDDSNGYCRLIGQIYNLRITAINGGWSNHVLAELARSFRMTIESPDDSYSPNGFDINGLYEGVNSNFNFEVGADIRVRGRFEGSPAGMLNTGADAHSIHLIHTNSNGVLSPWLTDWDAYYKGANSNGLSVRVTNEALDGFDHRLVAQFDYETAVSDGTDVSAASLGWRSPAAAITSDGLTFSGAGQVPIIAGEWQEAKRGDVIYSRIDADAGAFYLGAQIMKKSDGTVPAVDPDVVTHGFTKGTNWGYFTTGNVKGVYWGNYATDLFDVFIYTGTSGEYLWRPVVLRGSGFTTKKLRHAALWRSGRAQHDRTSDFVAAMPFSPALSATLTTPTKVGAEAYDGTAWRKSVKYERSSLAASLSSGATSISLDHDVATATTGDLVGIELDDGSMHFTAFSLANSTGGHLTAALPSAAAAGNRVMVGGWV